MSRRAGRNSGGRPTLLRGRRLTSPSVEYPSSTTTKPGAVLGKQRGGTGRAGVAVGVRGRRRQVW